MTLEITLTENLEVMSDRDSMTITMRFCAVRKDDDDKTEQPYPFRDYDHLELNGLELEGLQISTRIHRSGWTDKPVLLGGWYTDYRNLYSIDLDHAERMTKTIKTIFSKLDRVQKTWGNPASFGQFILQVCNVLKIKRVYHRDPNDKRPAYFGGHYYAYTDITPQAEAQRLDRIISDLSAELETKPADAILPKTFVLEPMRY